MLSGITFISGGLIGPGKALSTSFELTPGEPKKTFKLDGTAATESRYRGQRLEEAEVSNLMSVFPDFRQGCVDPFERADNAPADLSWTESAGSKTAPVYESVMADPAKMIGAAQQLISDGGLSRTLIPQPTRINPGTVAARASAMAEARDGLFDRITERVATELRALDWIVETTGTSLSSADMTAGVLPDGDDADNRHIAIGEAYATLRVSGEAIDDVELTVLYAADADRFQGFMSPQCGGMMAPELSGFLARTEHPTVQLNFTGDEGQLHGGYTLFWDHALRGGVPADELAKREDEIVRAIVGQLVEFDRLNVEHQAR